MLEPPRNNPALESCLLNASHWPGIRNHSHIRRYRNVSSRGVAILRFALMMSALFTRKERCVCPNHQSMASGDHRSLLASSLDQGRSSKRIEWKACAVCGAGGLIRKSQPAKPGKGMAATAPRPSLRKPRFTSRRAIFRALRGMETADLQSCDGTSSSQLVVGTLTDNPACTLLRKPIIEVNAWQVSINCRPLEGRAAWTFVFNKSERNEPAPCSGARQYLRHATSEALDPISRKAAAPRELVQNV
jgi:hypothetical protein